jgi:antitoxin MazE
MVIPLISIGNSKGIRIPKSVIRELGLGDDIEMSVEGGAVVLRAIRTRKSWGAAFAKMRSRGDDALVISDIYTDGEYDGKWRW